jgi:hypothetical protein
MNDDTLRQRALDIERRLRADLRATLASNGIPTDEDVLEALVGDAMHPVEKLLIEIADAQQTATLPNHEKDLP